MRRKACVVVLLGTLLWTGAAWGQVQNLELSCIRPVYIISDDFDRDGWLDLAIACHSCFKVVVVPNRGPLGKECEAFVSNSGKAWLLMAAKQEDAPLALASGYFLDAIPPARPLVFQDLFPHIVAVTQFTPGIVRIVPLLGTPPVGAKPHPFPPGYPWASWVIAEGRATLDVLRGKPNPTYPAHVVLADFNKDGRPDIAVADSLAHGGGVYVYLSPTGALPSLYEASSAQTPVATASLASPNIVSVPGACFLAAADFNRDGNTDLAVATGGSVKFLCGLGNGAFDTGTPSIVLGKSVTSIAAADLDGDGDVDVAATDPELGAVNILWNAGCWTFSVTRFKAEKAHFVHVFDCNRDGIPDLAVAQKDLDRVSVFSGQICGVVTVEANAVSGQRDRCPTCVVSMNLITYNLCTTFPLPQGSRPIGLVSGDFDRNGVPDLAVANNGFPNPHLSGIFPVQIIYNPCCCIRCDHCNVGTVRGTPCCPDGKPSGSDQPRGTIPPKG